MLKSFREWSWRRVIATRAFLVITAVATAGLAIASSIGPAANAQPGPQQATPQLPAAKQTTLGLYLTSKEAYEKWKAQPDKVTILDVRTPEEFIFVGHAVMAWNIPVAAQSYKWDADKKQFPMQPLADFVARVQKVAKPDDTLLVMCRSGGRSALAVNLLARAGFKSVYNIVDGMEGDVVKEPDSVFRGQHLVNGWKNSALPWSYETDPTRMMLPVEH